MTGIEVERVREDQSMDIVRAMVWEFFDALRERYPDMLAEIDEYVEHQDVAGELSRFSEFFLPPNGECFLAWLGKDPAGIVMLKPKGEQGGEMNRMYVRNAARGRGLGRQLGLAVIQEARALGYDILWLDALYKHVEALPLYESLGFVRYEDPDVFHVDDTRVIHMKLKLH